MQSIPRHLSAIRRSGLSRPVRLALDDSLINAGVEVFDYGCGYGDDVRALRERGITCSGWDPAHNSGDEPRVADVVNLGYVVNVIEDPKERGQTLRSAWALTRTVLIVAARLTSEALDGKQSPYGDGCLTRLGTFQKYYDHGELRAWVENEISVSAVPAGPGVFYIFRDPSAAQSFLASKYRRRPTAPRQRKSNLLFDKYKDFFERLMDFMASRGRLPEGAELTALGEIPEEVGSLRRGFKIIREVTGGEQWDKIKEERTQDLLIFLALSRFGGRPRLSQLPADIQLDVRAFCSTYGNASTLADRLLFSVGDMRIVEAACRQSAVGKLTPNALYVHVSALPSLSPVLRVYEGCARSYIGAVDAANVIKLHRHKPQISYLAYPEFERDPHPKLLASLVVPLNVFHIRYSEYGDSANPPILHRKEEFLTADNPLREKFARLTRQEEKAGLYEDTTKIGNSAGWEDVLRSKGVRISGHRLMKVKT
ncbi:MAG TPA: DNA phosphorothioation-associated putative methyltransferase [Pyrinomonadaceae bacterium]|nr:DNA phosphorothioation-associated putative methyltransferase [Pyrinomonadaceae bacterium]